MRVFVTGATGFIGSAVVEELLGAGHEVLGLARSEEKARALAAKGAEVVRGSLEDLDGFKRAAASAEGVIHLGFNHDFSKFAENCELDRCAIEALGEALAGSGRPLLVTSGLAMAVPGRLATEEDPPIPVSARYPRASEATADALIARGVRASVVRLPQVHDSVRQGLITPLIQIYREKGACGYVGDGSNRWAAAHVLDVAHLYRLALERGDSGAKYHAVAEEGVPLRAIAETIGRHLQLPVKSIAPEKAEAFFGWFGEFAGSDLDASSMQTREKLGWKPVGPTLLADLDEAQYAA